MANSYAFPLASALASFALASGASAQAPSIVPNADGIGTVVTQNGEQFVIEQGMVSRDRVNQFHSFESFSLSETESANFVAPDDIQNVVARVTGSASSLINGQIQITDNGSAPNLYLMNPSGILFGPNASLNLSGSFTATTASQIGFDQGWFDVAGLDTIEAVDAIAGQPSGDFVFGSSIAESGAIVNNAELSVQPDKSITLLGSYIDNAGTLLAPGGNVTLAAAPSRTVVKLRQPNGLVSLEFEPLNSTTESVLATDLPMLLTHSEQQHATELLVSDNGEAALTRAPAVVNTGSIDTSSDSTGGNITLVGETVSLSGATLSASGSASGGHIRIGGDYRGRDTLPESTHTTIDSATTIYADAINSGDGGQVIVWASDTTQYLGHTSARGGADLGDGGFVEISGKKTLLFDGTVDTRAPNGTTGSLLLDPENINIVTGRSATDDEQLVDGQILTAEISAQGDGLLTISEGMLASLSGATNIALEASNDIVVSPLNDGVLAFAPGTGEIAIRADADGDGEGDFVMRDRATTLIAPERNVTLSGANLLLGNINTVSTNRSLQSGNVTLEASGAVSLGDIDTFSYLEDGRSGNVSITAADILTGDISTTSRSQAGDVTLVGRLGDVTAGRVTALSSAGLDGETTFTAPDNITVDGATIQTAFFPEMPPPDMPPSASPAPLPPDIPIDERPTSNANTDANLVQALLPSLNALQASASSELTVEAASEDADSTGSHSVVLSSVEANEAIAAIETDRIDTFSHYFERELSSVHRDLEDIQQQLKNAELESGNRSAIVYVSAPKDAIDSLDADNRDAQMRPLEMMIITADRPAVKVSVPDVNSRDLQATITSFRNRLVTSARRGNTSYLADAQQLYQWIIAPIEQALGSDAIALDTLAFAMDEGLRSLPVAALHDGTQFLVEKYGVGMLPSVGLTNIDYVPLENAEVLAMGVSQFEQDAPLPGVPIEVEQIGQIWPGKTFLNEQLTRAQLKQQRAQTPYRIVHLATHADFNAGALSDSYIQLWDEQISLDSLDTLGWDTPAVDLLVLSACSTALGSPSAELGFAGLAIASGVRSAIASLWPVDDLGTLALMNELYQQLGITTTKADALQSAQLALLNGQVSVSGDQLVSEGSDAIDLPSELSQSRRGIDLSHPYYWAGFTLVGNPW